MFDLEERALLSTFTVTNGLDSGSGSLRAAIGAAVANGGSNVVAYTQGVTETQLSSGPLILPAGTEITIEGYLANGFYVPATINGGGTSDFLAEGAGDNIVLEGLSLTGFGSSTAISIGGTSSTLTEFDTNTTGTGSSPTGIGALIESSDTLVSDGGNSDTNLSTGWDIVGGAVADASRICRWTYSKTIPLRSTTGSEQVPPCSLPI